MGLAGDRLYHSTTHITSIGDEGKASARTDECCQFVADSR
jgi:hypothetical protein